MVPDIAGTGHSFNGAMAYYMHDKRQDADSQHLDTSERVDWTATRNLATDDPETATRIMIATSYRADQLKAAAGLKMTGNKSKAHVFAYSLSWAADEVAGLDKAEMLRAADASLKALGAENRQAVIVCHTDREHPHVHIIMNRVDPETGLLWKTDNNRYKLSDFANEYERVNGKIVTPKREEKRLLRQHFNDRKQRQDYAAAKLKDAGNRQPADKTPAGMLKEFQEQQKAQQKQEWIDLSVSNKGARGKIFDGADAEIAQAIAQHKAECKPIWGAYFKEERARQRDYDRWERAGIVGKLRNAFEAATIQKQTGQAAGRSTLSLVFANTISGQARRAVFEARAELNRQAMAARLRSILNAEISTLKRQRDSGLGKQREAFDQARTRLVEKQDAERAKIRAAWQQIYAARGKDIKAKSPATATQTPAAKAWGRYQPATSPAIERGPALTREEVARQIAKKEEGRKLDKQARDEKWAKSKRPSFISRPTMSPAPAGAGPRPQQKTATHLPAKTLPEVPPTPQMVNYAWQNATAVPTHFQKPSEIRAAFGEPKEGSSLKEKQERSRNRSKVRSRSRSRTEDNEI